MIDGIAMRVPTPDVSLTELTVRGRARDDDRRGERRVQGGGRGRAQGRSSATAKCRTRVGGLHRQPALVRSLDSQNTNVIDGTMVKVSGWYDNEWGYSSRCVDLLRVRRRASLTAPAPMPARSIQQPHRRRGRAASARSCASTSTCRSTTEGDVADDTRILRRRPTITALADARRPRRAAARTSVARRGRPIPKYSLAPGRRAGCASCSAPRRGAFRRETVRRRRRRGDAGAQATASVLPPREHALPRGRGEATTTRFARQFAALGDLYVNDAFGAAHRAHASHGRRHGAPATRRSPVC